jgi:hypothetical protein
MTLGRLSLIAVLATALMLIATQTAGADDPGTATLVGEEMLVQDISLSTIDCDPSRVSTVSYSASGIATGPYPGPFTVQGMVTIEPQTQPGPRTGTVEGPLQSLSETFTINSALGTVTGTKSLPPTGATPSDIGSCQHVTGFATGPITDATGTVVDVFSEPVYDAIVQQPSGTFHVTGDASISFTELDLDGMCMLVQCHFRQAAFDQSFLTSTSTQCDENENGQGNQDPGCQGQEGGR